MAEQPGGALGSLEISPDYRLYLSNLDLPEELVALAGVRTLSQIGERINHGEVPHVGWEITPTRRLAIDAWRGMFDPQPGEKPFAVRFHQGWAQGFVPGTVRAPSVRSAAINGVALATMPEARHSMETIRRMTRRILGASAVVYASQVDKNGNSADFTNLDVPLRIVQPAPEQFMATGGFEPYDYQKFHSGLWLRGINGLVIDTEHLTRGAYKAPDRKLEWGQVLTDARQTGTSVVGVHAAAGRVDSPHDDDRRRSMKELAAILKGPEAIGRTLMGEIIGRGYGIWRDQKELGLLPRSRKQTVDGGVQGSTEVLANEHLLLALMSVFALTMEVPYRGMKEYRGGKRLRLPDVISLHQDMAGHWAQYLEKLRQGYDQAHQLHRF